jgi:hypothetical protein
MESKEVEVTSRQTSRGISWLGGARFGRRPRPEGALRPVFGLLGTWQILLLNVLLAAVFFQQESLGPWVSLAAGAAVAGLTVLWLRRYGSTTVPIFRGFAWTLLALPLLLVPGPIARLFSILHR